MIRCFGLPKVLMPFPGNEEWMVVKYDFDRVDYQVKAVTNGNEITTSSLKILVLSNPWRISVKIRMIH